MYAVFQTGSKQYRVVEGQVIHIERLDIDVGNHVEFNQILLIESNECLHIGSPFIKNGQIVAEIIAQSLNQKIKIIKFRRRKHFRKFQGHRQCFTTIKIISINIINCNPNH
ncbi:50S ribosomal protein L21 [Blochmannia endosymbiont of Camponotus modoc]|uniref:50S ribosomal protein L21 n=1 Tax=Blochmannia endosymbiont of Camponotus modoc TaxID=2945587 RepID=UPI00202419F7|nr:50S ribosomal protein L21 [Blochmannia endosymbiont of Camponotus modoc]URJ29341.1 50S ribosomal protein L21 [Blochmannia endosymbiont of Camponotus modoc]